LLNDQVRPGFGEAYGKIIIRMKTPTAVTETTMPRLIPTLVAGFNTVATHIGLILIPLLLDLAIWLGPKVKIQTLGQPAFNSFITYLQSAAAPESQQQVQDTVKLLQEWLANFNLSVVIRTFPVGVPSLLAREVTVGSPLATNLIFEAPTITFIVLVILGLALTGFFLGTIYFNSLARFTVNPVLPNNNKKLFTQFGQNLVTALILLTMLIIVSVPGIMILTVTSMISPVIAEFLMLMAMFALLWLSVPLIFAPHGIYVLNQKAYPSMLLSIRMVRYFLPGAGTFVMMSALISEGLNQLWVLPEPTSWLTLVGIFGHSFVVTALLAASFIYYRGGLKWMQESIQNIPDPNIKADLGGPLGTK
jgi:hypothetical protein